MAIPHAIVPLRQEDQVSCMQSHRKKRCYHWSRELPHPHPLPNPHTDQLSGGLSSCSGNQDHARYPMFSMSPNPEKEGLSHSGVSQPLL